MKFKKLILYIIKEMIAKTLQEKNQAKIESLPVSKRKISVLYENFKENLP